MIKNTKPREESMNNPENKQKDDIGAFTAIGQLTTIIAPLLYILGQKYASSFFGSLGSEWIVPQLSFQEIIFYSLQITVPILTASFITLELLINGCTYEKIRKCIIYITLFAFLALTTCNFIWNINYSHNLIKITAYSFFIIYGAYITELFLAFRRGNSKNFKSGIGWIIGSTAFLFGSAGTLGDFDAMNALEFPENKFPLVIQSSNQWKPQTLRLVSRIGDKYLLMDYINGKKVFRIESNLDGYIIQSVEKYRQ
jgi:hypothetical protein